MSGSGAPESGTARRAVIVRYTTSDGRAEENAALVRAVFEELAESAPDGLDYATLRLSDGVTFLHVACFDGEDNPLATSPAFAAFQAGIGERCTSPPEATTATLVGAYRSGGR